jgi:hypothetical protein
MYPLILSFETINKLKLFFECGNPRRTYKLQVLLGKSHASRCRNTFACATAKNLTHFLISIAVLENVPPDAGLQKRAIFSNLNVGLARPPAWQAASQDAQPFTTPLLGAPTVLSADIKCQFCLCSFHVICCEVMPYHVSFDFFDQFFNRVEREGGRVKYVFLGLRRQQSCQVKGKKCKEA